MNETWAKINFLSILNKHQSQNILFIHDANAHMFVVGKSNERFRICVCVCVFQNEKLAFYEFSWPESEIALECDNMAYKFKQNKIQKPSRLLAEKNIMRNTQNCVAKSVNECDSYSRKC